MSDAVEALPPMHHLDVKRAVAKLVEGDLDVVTHGMALKYFSKNLHGPLNLSGRCLIGDPDIHHRLDVRTARHIGDDGVAHGLIGHGNQMPVPIPDSCAAHADRFHRSIDTGELDAVSNLKWFINKDRHRSEQIA